MKEVTDFFDRYLDSTGTLTELPQSGSARKNYIAEGNGNRYILTTNEDVRENESFLYFSKVFESLQLNTPKILEISSDRKMYLQEYLGEQTLFEYLLADPNAPDIKPIVQSVLEDLYQLQMRTQNGIDYSMVFEYETYNELPILHDLYYFKFLLVDLLEVSYHKTKLLLEFKQLTHLIENLSPKGLMIRDFQSRNIILDSDKKPYFIDYQSAMQGPLLYDVVSFLYQAKAPFSAKFRKEMLDYYINLFEASTDRQALRQAVMPLRFIRSLQVLGAYGMRGLVQRKAHFLSSLELGIKNAVALSTQWKEMRHFPELLSVITALKEPKTQTKIKSLLQTGINK